jgi:hypothetical protein
VKCTQATNLAGRRGRSDLTDHVFSDAVTGGNVRSDHHVLTPASRQEVSRLFGVKAFTSDLHGIQEDSRAQLHVKIRRLNSDVRAGGKPPNPFPSVSTGTAVQGLINLGPIIRTGDCTEVANITS